MLYRDLLFLFRVKMEGEEYQVRAKTHDRNIQQGADIPTKVFCDLMEDNERGICRPNEKHINGSFGNIPEDQVDDKRDCAEADEGNGREAIVFHCFSATVGNSQIKTDEHEQHMPHEGVECQCPVLMGDSGRFYKGHKATQKAEDHHEIVHCLLNRSFFKQGSEDA